MESTKEAPGISNGEKDQLNDITQEFLKQNEIIDAEINRYDNMLDSWPMIFYRIWIFIYVALLSVAIILGAFAIPKALSGEKSGKYVDAWLDTIFVFGLGVSVYGCLQMWKGLSSRDIVRVNKAIAIFKKVGQCCAFISVTVFVILCFYDIPWEVRFCALIPIIIALINLLPAYYAKGVLEKRSVFQNASSSPNNNV